MRKKSGWTHTVTCPEDDCEQEINACYYVGSKGNTYGPPEACEPPYGADLDYEDDVCPKCGRKFTDKDVDRWIEKIEEEEEDSRDDY